MHSEEVIKGGIFNGEKISIRLKYPIFIFVALVFMAVAIVYVWSHVRTTELEYKISEEIRKKEQLTEEQRKLKVEIATLKSPKRIEAIAKDNLQMSYPERDQIIILK